jgi:hypothetical protein
MDVGLRFVSAPAVRVRFFAANCDSRMSQFQLAKLGVARRPLLRFWHFELFSQHVEISCRELAGVVLADESSSLGINGLHLAQEFQIAGEELLSLGTICQ